MDNTNIGRFYYATCFFFLKKKEKGNGIVNDSVMGEKIYNKLIVMDDVSGFADISNDFANFLTVARRFNFICVYVFHTI